MNAEQLAQFFHETYERLSGQGRSWTELGDDNKVTLVAAMREVLLALYGEHFVKMQEDCARIGAQMAVDAERRAAEQARICACGHAVGDHHNLATPDGTLYLLCATPPYTCGDTKLLNGASPRCSIPAEVTG